MRLLNVFLCSALALAAASWLGWETLIHFRYFDGFFANGAFQLLDPLRRVMDGQVYSRDFLNFHGIGTVWLHVPIYVLLGSTLAASEASRYATSAILCAAAATALAIGFSRAFPDRRRAVLYGLLFFAAGSALFSNTAFPANSLLGVRSFFPLVLGAIIAFRGPNYAVALCLAGALLTSVEHGIATLLSLVASASAAFLLQREKQALVGRVIAAFSGIVIALLVLGIATKGNVAEALRYSFVDIPQDQFWYFGAPPNAYLQQDWRAVYIYYPYIKFMAVYCLGWTASLWLVWRHRKLSATAAFFMVYATLGLISQLGYMSGETLQASERAAFAVVLAAAFLVFQRLTVITVLAASATIVGCGVETVERYGAPGRYPEVSGISPEWAQHLAAVKTVLQDGTIWSVYSGLPELETHQFNPSFDYIIHAVGPENRERYTATFRNYRPSVARLDDLWSWRYGPWLLIEDWPFYREVFSSYEPVYRDAKGSLWRPAATQSRSHESFHLTPDPSGCIALPEIGAESVFTVTADYQVENKWRTIPLIGKTPRLLVHVSGTFDKYFDLVSVPSEGYGGKFTFPILASGGEKIVMCPEAASFFPTTFQLLGATVRQEQFSSSVMDYLFKRMPLATPPVH